MKKLLIIPLLALALTSCGNRNANRATTADSEAVGTVPDTHNSRNSLDYAGTYEGVIPCADCPGIELTITLDGNGNYTKSMVYKGKEDKKFLTSGRYEWDEPGNVITLIGDSDPHMFHVGENKLFILDSNGAEITGELIDRFVLKKKASE